MTTTTTLAFQARALAKLRFSERFWRKDQGRFSADDGSLELQDEFDVEEFMREWPMKPKEEQVDQGEASRAAFFQACARGDVNYIDAHGGELLLRHPTALHRACAAGQYAAVVALLKFCNKKMVNFRDTVRGGTTPLMEATRSKCGDAKWRKQIVHRLVQAGAEVSAQDEHGDTCLHWAIRCQELGVAKYILRCTDSALFVLNMENLKNRKPIDVADLAMKTHGENYSTLEIHRLLADIQRGSSVRMKIQTKKRSRIAEETRRRCRVSYDRARAMELARNNLAAALGQCKNQHLQAEKKRMEEEEAYVEEYVRKARIEAESWLQGPYGSNELKNLARQVKQDMKQQINQGSFQGKPPANINLAAKQKATEMIIRRKQNEAKSQATGEFRKNNPPILT